MNKISIYLFVIAFLFPAFAKSQSVEQPSNLAVVLEPISDILILDQVSDTLTDPLSLISQSDSLSLYVSMTLPDTITISKIYVKLGRSNGGTDLSDAIIDFDDYNMTNITYLRNEESILLGFGVFTNLTEVFCEVFIEDLNGNLSSILSTNTTD